MGQVTIIFGHCVGMHGGMLLKYRKNGFGVCCVLPPTGEKS